ncbi:hypothetical protein [Paraburkholderia sp. ZP32-5]|nr:hypothetical protein [Paraburkholderia sp. ZP32-5]
MGINWSAFYDMAGLPMLVILGIGVVTAIVYTTAERLINGRRKR